MGDGDSVALDDVLPVQRGPQDCRADNPHFNTGRGRITPLSAQSNRFRTECGTVIGNVDRKYESTNPIARTLMNGFLSSFDELVLRTGERVVHEIGCGEGHLSARLAQQGLLVRSCDFSHEIVGQAAREKSGLGIEFQVKSIYDLVAGVDSAPLVVCCEVLEHLEDPESGLERLSAIADNYCLVSVPREPIWRILNMARGKYLGEFGNTPGHLQHWSRRRFVSFVRSRFDIVEVQSPLPWTMILCRAKSR